MKVTVPCANRAVQIVRAARPNVIREATAAIATTCFSTSKRSASAASRAAGSATPGVPTQASTIAEGLAMPATCLSCLRAEEDGLPMHAVRQVPTNAALIRLEIERGQRCERYQTTARVQPSTRLQTIGQRADEIPAHSRRPTTRLRGRYQRIRCGSIAASVLATSRSVIQITTSARSGETSPGPSTTVTCAGSYAIAQPASAIADLLDHGDRSPIDPCHGGGLEPLGRFRQPDRTSLRTSASVNSPYASEAVVITGTRTKRAATVRAKGVRVPLRALKRAESRTGPIHR